MLDLDNITEEELLQTRLCELPVKIKDTWLEDCIQQIHAELANQGLVFQPKFYLADEWLTPDQEPIIGIPFYLAHPTLIKLEKKMMLEAEGETRDWCLKLLRHECGHAINYAYKFYKKRKWQHIFGNFSEEYADVYRFRPYSKSFVRHLEDYYAQYHPDEDFAETFAVWLTPDSNWQEKYKGWKALSKLQYVDTIISEIKTEPPLVTAKKEYWQVSKLKRTLKNHYKQRQVFHAEDFPHFHDENLMKIFAVKNDENKQNPKAAIVLQKHKKIIIESMSRWTGEKKYVAGDLINKLIHRCRDLELICTDSEPITLMRISTYMATLLMNYMYTGRWRGEK